MMTYRLSSQKEQGVVSILSVIFFIILMSILTVSFLRIVTDEQTQVIDDDLSKGAYAAAQSGVEDAKRALLRCRSLTGGQQTACYNALNNQPCPGIFADATLLNDLGLTANRQPDGSIRVGDPSNNNNQRYTCVTVSRNTNDYVGRFSDGLAEFIPLRGVGSFNQIRISWHLTSSDGLAAIPPAGAISLGDNPRTSAWRSGAGTDFIAMPRLQLVEFDTARTLSAMGDSSTGTFLVPNTDGTNAVDVADVSMNGMPKRAAINCMNPAPQAGYLCTAVLNLNFVQPATAQYYLLVKSQYGTPHYRVELLDSDVPVAFDDVQPLVDSTGAAANVFKRLLSRVTYVSDSFFTTNVIEGGGSVCKDFYVTDDAFSNACGALQGIN